MLVWIQKGTKRSRELTEPQPQMSPTVRGPAELLTTYWLPQPIQQCLQVLFFTAEMSKLTMPIRAHTPRQTQTHTPLQALVVLLFMQLF